MVPFARSVYNAAMNENNGHRPYRLLRYRILPSEEWDKLAPIFQKKDWFLPPSMLSTASVAEDDGIIVGGQLLQCVLHAEPAWVEPGYSGLVNMHHIWRSLDELPKERKSPLLMPGFVLVAPSYEIARMAEIAGFQKVEGALYKREW